MEFVSIEFSQVVFVMSNNSVQASIEEKLADAFDPQHLQVENESSNHSVPPDSETHFKVVMVSASFSDQRLVARHQSVYGVLADELKSGVHALALHLYTESEWQDKAGGAPMSPPCLGGKAAEDGRNGDFIRVLNAASKRYVTGRVDDKGTVHVRF